MHKETQPVEAKTFFCIPYIFDFDCLIIPYSVPFILSRHAYCHIPCWFYSLSLTICFKPHARINPADFYCINWSIATREREEAEEHQIFRYSNFLQFAFFYIMCNFLLFVFFYTQVASTHICSNKITAEAANIQRNHPTYQKINNKQKKQTANTQQSTTTWESKSNRGSCEIIQCVGASFFFPKSTPAQNVNNHKMQEFTGWDKVGELYFFQSFL